MMGDYLSIGGVVNAAAFPGETTGIAHGVELILLQPLGCGVAILGRHYILPVTHSFGRVASSWHTPID